MSSRTFYPLPPGPCLRTDYWKRAEIKNQPLARDKPTTHGSPACAPPIAHRFELEPMNIWLNPKTPSCRALAKPDCCLKYFLTWVSGANEIYVDDLHTKIKQEKEPLFISHFIFFQQFFSWRGVTLIGDSCFCCCRRRRRRRRRRRHQRHVEWNQILIKFVFQISAKGLLEFSKWHPRALWAM